MKTEILRIVKNTHCKSLTEARIRRYSKALKSATEGINDAIEYNDDMNQPIIKEWLAEKAICEVALETNLDPIYCQKELTKITGFTHSVLFHA